MTRFIPDTSAIQKAQVGDFGITESLFKNIQNVNVQETGMKMLEKTIISSLIESQNPLTTLSNRLFEVYAASEDKVKEIVSTRLLPELGNLENKIMSAADFLGQIGISKIKEKFTILNDKNKAQYLNGKSSIKLDVNILGYKAQDGDITIYNIEVVPPKQPMLSTVLGFLKLPFGLLKGVFNATTDFANRLLPDTANIPNILDDFSKFQWLKDLLTTNILFEFLDATPVIVETIPFFNMPQSDLPNVQELLRQFKEFIVDILNVFIGMPQSIFGIDLGLHISI